MNKYIYTFYHLVNKFINLKLFLLIITILLFLKNGYGQSNHEIEYRLKAVYLLNFLQFAEWPQKAFKNENTPITLGIFGEDPFGKIIDETVQGEKIGNHPIIIKRIKNLDEISFCHVLFISLSKKESYKNILKQINKASILTISDINGFSEEGGNIGFYIEDNKVRFSINLQTLKQADIKVSSKLLRLAKVINPI